MAAAFALLVCAGIVQSQPAGAQGPNFSTVSDVLAGRRHLLRVDDLVVAVDQSDPGFFDIILHTQNAQIVTPQIDDPSLAPPCAFLPFPIASGLGRFFDFPNDVVISAVFPRPVCSGNMEIFIRDPKTSLLYGPFKTTQVSGFLGAFLLLADFNQDGYDDILLTNGDQVQIFTAANPEAPNQGVKAGPVFSFGAETISAEPAVGDFDGDGRLDIAMPTVAKTVRFMSVDPTTLQLSLRSTSIPIGVIPNLNNHFVLTAGNYDDNARDDELLVVSGPAPRSATPPSTTASVYDFDANLTPTRKDLLSLPVSPVQSLFAASGRLNWFGGQEQAVIGMGASQGESLFTIVTFDENLQMTSHPGPALAEASCPFSGLVLGRFDPPPENGEIDFNLQIATMIGSASGCAAAMSSPIVELFTVNPTTFDSELVPESRFAVANVSDEARLSLAVGDTQGRSLRLGEPQKVTITSHMQPDVILGVPPMHVDFITPANGSGPTVLNLSADPDSFFSRYETMVKSSNQSSQKSTTSYSFSTKETAGQTVSFGIPFIDSISVSAKEAAEQTHKNVVSKTFNTYASKSFDASTTTGFGDQIWFSQKRFNVYSYPVIGQTVCPNGNSNCSDSQKLPLRLQFSGPDMVSQNSITASTVEWYQPAHEPGNVLSYPWDFDRIKALHPDLTPLTSTSPIIWFTDSSTITQQADWTQEQGSDVSTGSTRTHSFDTSVSISGDVTLEDFGIGGGASASFSYNKSKSLSTLNTSVAMVGDSTGVGVTKPGTFANPIAYKYAVQPFIFGQQNPPGTLQTIPLNTTITSTGALRTAFAADPTDPDAGSWWMPGGPYSQALDVALSHPSRWYVSAQRSIFPPIPNCLLTDAMGDAMDCTTFNAPPDLNDQNTCPNLSCLWTSEFHSMRGLLITPAAANGFGPQVLTTVAGDQLLLQARVYNYSLMDIPAEVSVHVRFYGQEWDHASNTPIGESLLIDEVTLGGGAEPTICGFRSSASSCASDNEPNWKMVSTTFDTTDFAEQYLTFWMVVWMEDANGSLVKELDGHGLSELPGTLTSIAQVPLEMVSALECQLTGSSNLDCNANTSKTQTSFSNNVGFYKQALFVFSPQNTPEKAVPLAADKRDASLAVENITVSPPQAMINEKVEVSALLSTSDEPADGVLATFYDGDPIANGRAFDVELVPHIRANDVFQIRVPFRPRTCGTHELFVVVGEGTDAPAQTKATLEVACQPLAVTKLVGKAYRVGSG